MSKPFFVTTPIYYVNSVPHIGTTLTTIAADVTARYQRMRGNEVVFLTGTDENGIKVYEAAVAAGDNPQFFVDRISEAFKQVFREMHISYDLFIRTTEKRHHDASQALFELLRERGHIYQGKYEGWYDVSSETFYKESDLIDGKSPDGNEVRWVEEDNWFFKLSAFGDALLEHIGKNPNFIIPESRKNEVVGFIRQGLRDACISRANQGWGIEIPGDSGKVMYVWFDALINYLTACGWPNAGWEKLWPANAQWMGKDILTRFHATLWPAMLLGAGLPLPGTLIGHAWMMMDGSKISKSRGNVVEPVALSRALAERAGCTQDVAVDAVRHYVCAAMPFENDTNYTDDEFFKKYNSDLANDLGNALNRSLAMTHKFAEGVVPGAFIEADAAAQISKCVGACAAAYDAYRIDHAVAEAWNLIRFLNKYIDSRAPWALAKNNDSALPNVLRSMLMSLRVAEGLIRPIMPSVADEIAAQLGVAATENWSDLGAEKSLPGGTKLADPTPIFPRLDLATLTNPPPETEEKKVKPSKPKSEPPEEISIDDFMRVQLKVARILEAEDVPESKKLLKLQVMIGSERRQILAGIKQQYAPIDLIGRQVVVVANLKPARLMGLESQGMILAADGPEGGAILLMPDSETPEGTSVH